jgi:hypothetical protein
MNGDIMLRGAEAALVMAEWRSRIERGVLHATANKLTAERELEEGEGRNVGDALALRERREWATHDLMVTLHREHAALELLVAHLVLHEPFAALSKET